MVLTKRCFSLAFVHCLLFLCYVVCGHPKTHNNHTYFQGLNDFPHLETVKEGEKEFNIYDHNDPTDVNTLDRVDNGKVTSNETLLLNKTYSNYSTPTNNNCSLCSIRQRDKRMRVELIKQQILTKLHFKTLPNMTDKVLPKIPSLASLLERSTEDMQGDSPYRTGINEEYDEDYDYYGRVDRVYTLGKPVPKDLGIKNEHACYFTMPAEVQNVRIRMAILWFYVQPSEDSDHPIKLRVHKICNPSVKCGGKDNTVRIHYKKHSPNHRRGKSWQRIDLHDLVKKWINYPETNYGLVLTAYDQNGKNLVVTPQAEGSGNKGYEPMLEFEVQEMKKRRPKRSIALVCTDEVKEKRCCRYPLEVDFVDFGWDWVIAPMRYKADYCAGECQTTHQEAHPHAFVSQITTPNAGGPCCTPTKLLPLSLLYFDHEHNILYTDLKNMKVTKCGCA